MASFDKHDGRMWSDMFSLRHKRGQQYWLREFGEPMTGEQQCVLDQICDFYGDVDSAEDKREYSKEFRAAGKGITVEFFERFIYHIFCA